MEKSYDDNRDPEGKEDVLEIAYGYGRVILDNPDDIDIYKRNDEKSGIPGVLSAESGKREE